MCSVTVCSLFQCLGMLTGTFMRLFAVRSGGSHLLWMRWKAIDSPKLCMPDNEHILEETGRWREMVVFWLVGWYKPSPVSQPFSCSTSSTRPQSPGTLAGTVAIEEGKESALGHIHRQEGWMVGG